MGNVMKKHTKTTNNSVENAVDTEITTTVVSVNTESPKIAEVKTEEVSKVEKKVYTNETPIPCMSIVSGELGMEGIKSNINYRWAERGDVTDVEYQDLVAAIRSSASFIIKPYFIIMDDEFVKQFPQVEKIYKTLYSIHDLKDVLRMPATEMRTTILSLPDGAKESIKNIAATMINNGTLDSVQKIRILDEIFDTKLMMLTELYD